MSKGKIYFRADGNNQIGLGHVIRSLALAEMLKDRFDCIFMIQEPSSKVIDEIKKTCKEFIKLKVTNLASEGLNEATEIINKYITADDVVVLDGYDFNEEYQSVIKSKGCKLVYIDDLNKQHFVADVVINHALNADPKQYSTAPYTLVLAGSKFVLLRKAFFTSFNKESKQAFNRTFVCFGGADKENLSYNISSLLSEMKDIGRINVLIGSAYQGDLHKLKSLNNQKVNVYQNINEEAIINVMQQSDFAIVSASGVAYECAAVGLPFITGYYNDTQLLFYAALIQQPNVVGVDSFIETDQDKLQSALTKLKSGYNAEAEGFIDRKQQERYIEVFNKLFQN